MTVIERFLKLVSFDTTSSETSGLHPSTPNQKVLGQELVRQMLDLGIRDARMDDLGYVYGTIPANCEKDLPVYGLIAHMDTSPDAPGGPIRARITEPYDGGDIVLNEEKGIVLSPKDYESLQKHAGKRLIVTDGTTLLGADDKAGVAEILSAAELLLSSNRPHGTVKIAFTPDEEIGEGADGFDVKGFGADYAYTVDGGAIGELEYENFNAASALVGAADQNIVDAVFVAGGKLDLFFPFLTRFLVDLGDDVLDGRLFDLRLGLFLHDRRLLEHRLCLFWRLNDGLVDADACRDQHKQRQNDADRALLPAGQSFLFPRRFKMAAVGFMLHCCLLFLSVRRKSRAKLESSHTAVPCSCKNAIVRSSARSVPSSRSRSAAARISSTVG